MSVPSLTPGDPTATFNALGVWKTTLDALSQNVADLLQSTAAEAAARVAGDQAEANARGLQISAASSAEAAARAVGDQNLSTALAQAAADSFRRDAAEAGARVLGDASNGRNITALGVELRARLDALDQALEEGLSSARTAYRYDLVSDPGRPGDTPACFTFVSRAVDLGGSRSALPDLPGALLAVDDSGAVARVTGAGILGSRRAFALEPGRLSLVRFAIQRRTDPTDPTGDAVLCGLIFLDQALAAIGDPVAVQLFPTLVRANGRQTCQALFSRTAGLGGTITVPNSARYVAPAVVIYGADGTTDVEVLALSDVTDIYAR
jgi:hypothetical protein